MERLVQPEREIVRRGWPAMALAGACLLLLALLAAWVVDVAAGTIAIAEFKDLTLGAGIRSRGASRPLWRLLTGEVPGGVNTMIAGTDENPMNHPQVEKAEWALGRDHWSAPWRYYVALAYWREAQQKQDQLDSLRSRLGTMKPEGAGEANKQIDALKVMVQGYETTAYQYLVMAIDQDPANGFMRYTASEMSKVLDMDPTTQANLDAISDSRIPGDACLLTLVGQRLEKEGKTAEALEAYKRALVAVKMDIRDGLVDSKGDPAGPIFLGQIVSAFDKMLKNYDGWAQYVPEDTEVHLRLAAYLQDQYEKTKADRFLESSTGERAKGIRAGETSKGELAPEVLYLIGDACRVNGDLDKSITYFQEAVEQRPEKADWGLALAKVQMMAMAEAQKRGEQAQAAGDTAAAHAETGKAWEYLRAAGKTVDKILGYEPSNSDALNMSRAIGEKKGSLAP